MGFMSGTDSEFNDTAGTYVYECFRRAKGFFDIVAYTGTGVARTVNHSLGVAPELMIVKSRSLSQPWATFHSSFSVGQSVALNTTSAVGGTSYFDALPTNSVFSVSTGSAVNNSTNTYISYLFASLPNVSRVGSYTGNGTTQTINCGFSSGARFFLCKASSTTGSWWVFDSARGILASTDFGLQLNSTAAEVTSADAVDPASVGIIVNQQATGSINANGVTYIYLAIA
jgi:hypothetical protein